MAKKKTVPDVPDDGRVMVGGRIPRSLHVAAKHLAVDQRISMQELLVRALEEQVAKAAKR